MDQDGTELQGWFHSDQVKILKSKKKFKIQNRSKSFKI